MTEALPHVVDECKRSETEARSNAEFLYSPTVLWQKVPMEKDFTQWHGLKGDLQVRSNTPAFSTREIWWCHVGMNIGHEVDGKGKGYNRPVLVVRKFNQHIFLGVPLTTKIKDNAYYQLIHFKGQQQCVMLSQLRLWESKRLTIRMGQLSHNEFEKVRKALRKMI